MERKECFGSINEVALEKGFTQIQTNPECRDCQEFRDCIRQSKQDMEEKKERDELRGQEMIARIIDLSQMLSNEVGSCLLEFLNRIYSSSLEAIFFENLLLFYEIPKETLSFSLTVPISRSIFNLVQGDETKAEQAAGQTTIYQQRETRDGFFLRIVLIQRSFPNNPKANMGLIAHEVARLFSSDSDGVNQILKTLSASENNRFKKMDTEQRVKWLMEEWGFSDELEALKKERARLDEQKKC